LGPGTEINSVVIRRRGSVVSSARIQKRKFVGKLYWERSCIRCYLQ